MCCEPVVLGESPKRVLCRHHEDRVKKLITEPGNPNLIISAAEDSTGESSAMVPLKPAHGTLPACCRAGGMREAGPL